MTTPIYKISELQSAQLQPEAVVNPAIRVLEAMSPLIVKSIGATVAPSTPAEGDRHIVGKHATGAWSAKDLQIALWMNAAWVFIQPQLGQPAYNSTTNTSVRYIEAGSPQELDWV